MEKIESFGKCMFCDELIGSTKIGTHLAKHLLQKEKEITATQKTKTFNHLVVQDKYNKNMFLQLLVDSDDTLDDVDSYLRAIWLECCGHMSSFYVKQDEFKMSKKVSKVFSLVKELTYDYDFGSTTTLTIKFLKTYTLSLPEGVILLSRNEPLKIMCDGCNKATAVVLCAICYGESGLLGFCKKCAKKHTETCEDFADYAEVEIVNSPRCGECGYSGGQIDLKRDGVYKEPKTSVK